jgi:hypothetical protein
MRKLGRTANPQRIAYRAKTTIIPVLYIITPYFASFVLEAMLDMFVIPEWITALRASFISNH